MSDLYNKIVDQRGAFERLIARIPGFSGYLEKASRRTADRMMRDYVAGRVAQRVRRMADMERRLLDLKGGLLYMSKTARVKARIQLYHDKINAATPGYSGFMDAIKIEEAELERLYSFDEAQMRYVDQLDGALDKLDAAIKVQAGQASPDGALSIDDALATVEAVIEEALQAYALRDEVIAQLG
ncbi:MAG: hypothetical protein SF162_04375 [bacterium]|nr:hypothetical protein [bacterium]